MFRKKTDPLDDFVQKEVNIGIKTDSRIQVVSTGYDTATVLALDAEKMFKDMEAKKSGKGAKKGKDAKK